jgi:uncharacterized protein (UPF0261 family)
MSVHVIATLDTKGPEAQFVCRRLNELEVPTTLVDAAADIHKVDDRGEAVAQAARDVCALISSAYARGEVSGVLSLGGSAGTLIGTAAMQAVPLGVPKVMVSTLASGQTRPYVGSKDILMLNAVVDIAGINRISRQILNEAAAAIAGMVKFRAAESGDVKPLVAATMFGVTTPCVRHAAKILEEAGYEVLVFHATGNGGEAMESLIREGLIAGVLDITTTELADELVGGTLSAGPDRLTAAADCGVPQVVSVGALDMVNFGPRNSVPDKFNDRKFHRHNDNVTLMRTTAQENRQLGHQIARQVARSAGPAAILLPLQGISAIDRVGQPFDDPAARTALFEGVRAGWAEAAPKRETADHAAPPIDLVELDCHINDVAFAEAAARKLLQLIQFHSHLPRC